MIKRFYLTLIEAGTAFQPFLLLAIRLFWGISFMLGGWGKIHNIEGVAGFFENLHIPFPEANAYFVSYMEFIGGLCLTLGFASRLVAIPLAVIMLVALLTAHSEAFSTVFQDPSAFIAQGPFTFLMACLIIFAFGPGGISVDGLLKKGFKK